MKLTRPLLVLAAAMLSCQVILGLEEPTGTARQEEQPEASVAATDPCAHQLPPAPLMRDDDPATTDTYWFAAVRLDAPLKADGGVQPGFDLDNSCSCQKDLFDGGPTCRTPGKGITCDFPNGVDDAFGTFASQYTNNPLLPLDPMKPVNSQLESGVRTLLIYLKDYNGRANDSDVSVDIIPSGGLYTNLGCDGAPRNNPVTFIGSDEGSPGTRYAPLNDGCDRWSPAPGNVLGMYPKRVAIRTTAAYVSNFDLVVSLKDTGAPIFGGATTVTNSKMVAHLTKGENGKWRAEGVIAGRIAFVDLLDLAGRTPVDKPGTDGGKQPFCETNFWTSVGPGLCSARDVMASPSEERLGKVCDATSAVFAFKLVQAEVSDVEFKNPQTASTCQSSAIRCPD